MFNKRRLAGSIEARLSRGVCAFSSRLSRLFSSLAFVLLPGVLRAEELSYHYVSFNAAKLPAGFVSFGPSTIVDSGRVYGYACDDLNCIRSRVAFYDRGVVTVLAADGFATAANDRGVIGGAVAIDPDPDHIIVRAAFFRGGKVELVAPQPGETFSLVTAINDRGEALIESSDAEGTTSYLFYCDGRARVLSSIPGVGRPYFRSARVLNDHGVLVGIKPPIYDGARGFRYDVRRNVSTLLEPEPTETLSWAMGINKRGDVLGYSFTATAPYVERIGFWNRQGHFKTYFVSNTSSDFLFANDDNLIVISAPSRDTSYIIPEPGTRLNLADVVTDLPADTQLRLVTDMNNRGDIIGSTNTGDNFLLERCDRQGGRRSGCPTSH